MRTAPADVGRLEAFQALRYTTFRRIWIAFVLSQTGNWMQITARAILVFQITGSVTALGTIYLVSYSPQLVFALAGGAVADRVDRRHIAIGGLSVQTAFALGFAGLAASGTATLLNLSILSFLVGTVQTMQQPATMALLPALVPRRALPSAVSLQGTATSITRTIGPLAAGVLIPLVGVEWAFVANALTFAFPLYAWSTTRVPATPETEEARGWPMIKRGLRTVRRSRTLLVPIITLWFLSAIGIAYQPLGVAYATDVLANGDKALGDAYYGYVQAAIGIGSGVGIIGLAGMGRRYPSRTVIWTAVGFSLSLVALSFVDTIVPALIVSAILGAMHFANAMLIVTIAQHEAAEDMRGRIMSVVTLAWIGFLPFTSQLFGWTADATSVSTTFLGAGLACLAFSLGLIGWRDDIRMLHPDSRERESQLLPDESVAEAM